jgi:hypothetical protein
MNFYDKPLAFELPQTNYGNWYRISDTACEPGEDFVKDGMLVEESKYTVEDKSVVVMINKKG